jgi:hypothetical protein
MSSDMPTLSATSTLPLLRAWLNYMSKSLRLGEPTTSRLRRAT